MIYFITKEQFLFSDLEGIKITSNFTFLLDYFKGKTEIGFDTETTGFNPYVDKVLLYQLGNREVQFVVDPVYFPIPLIRHILEDPNNTIIMQNAKFDLGFLYQYSVIPSKIYDTFLAESVLFTGIKSTRKGLDHLARKYCEVELDKSVRNTISSAGKTARVIKYAADDVKYLPEIKEKQEIDLIEKDLVIALELDNLFVKVLAYVEHCGIYLNTDLWKVKMEKDNLIYTQAKIELDKWIIDNNFIDFIDPQLDLFNPGRSCSINWASSKQVIPLMKKLGVDTEIMDENTGKMKDSIEAPVIKKQIHKSELIPVYLEYKAAEKRVTTYGQNYLDIVNPVTSRIHSSFTQILATGRMSCGGKRGDTQLVNLQNIPKEEDTRSCFTNQYDDTVLVNADYSQQEQIVLANFSQDKNLIKFYQDGLGDMHSYVSSKIFPELAEVPLGDIKKDYPEKRDIAKTAGFAINYGGAGMTIAENVGISVEEGDKVYNAYMKAFPDLKDYFAHVTKLALDRGYIMFNNVSRRKSFIPYFNDFLALKREVKIKGFWDTYKWHKENQTAKFEQELRPLVSKYYKKKGEIGRLAQNYPIQGSSAEITKLAGIHLFDYIIDNHLFNVVKISNIVHDEILCECPIYNSDSLSENLKMCMEKAGNRFCKVVPLKAIPVIGKKWEH